MLDGFSKQARSALSVAILGSLLAQACGQDKAVEPTEATFLSDIRQLTLEGPRAERAISARMECRWCFKVNGVTTIRSTKST